MATKKKTTKRRTAPKTRKRSASVTPACDVETVTQSEIEQAIDELAEVTFEADREKRRDSQLAAAERLWIRDHPKTMACAMVATVSFAPEGLTFLCEACGRSTFYAAAGLEDEVDAEANRTRSGAVEALIADLELSMDGAVAVEKIQGTDVELGAAGRPASRYDADTVHRPDLQPTRPAIRPGYRSLAEVLDEALSQAQEGKGIERHSGPGEAFEDQQIVQLCEWMGSIEGDVFQACKKSLEARRLPYGPARRELLGAINYLAAAVIVLDRMQRKPPF